MAHIHISAMTADGDGLGVLDGREIRVFGALPGEAVEPRIRSDRKPYLFADAESVLESSPSRVAPLCQYFGDCTGCQWQHVKYGTQLEIKRRKVQAAMEARGLNPSLVQPVTPADEPWAYRNHARFTLRRDGTVGFVHRETRRFIRIDHCRIMHPWINSALAKMQGSCKGMTQASVRYGVNTGSWLVQPRLSIPIPELASGQKYYEELLCGRRFRISSPSFFQVNIPQAEKLVTLALACLRPSGNERVIDAYCGVGTFAVAIAPHVGEVIAIEESSSSIADARENIAGLDNIRLVQGKVESEMELFHTHSGAVIVDPPRSGCHQAFIDAAGRSDIGKVVYVSCDPDTLARDVALLCRWGFQMQEVTPVDMFPQTHRTECIALLERCG
ncbi:MAG: class I SAM-dependent RNA methyltransferase [Chloroflexi bacterium]|nr:class I SAM-dependent RNA methyltransferase [Chloroflexota bacterium]